MNVQSLHELLGGWKRSESPVLEDILQSLSIEQARLSTLGSQDFLAAVQLLEEALVRLKQFPDVFKSLVQGGALTETFLAVCAVARRTGTQASIECLSLICFLAGCFARHRCWTGETDLFWKELSSCRKAAKAQPHPHFLAQLSIAMADLLLAQGMGSPALDLLRGGLHRMRAAQEDCCKKVAVRGYLRLLHCLRGEDAQQERAEVTARISSLLGSESGHKSLPAEFSLQRPAPTVRIKLPAEFYEKESQPAAVLPAELVREVLLQRLRQATSDETVPAVPPTLFVTDLGAGARITFGQQSAPSTLLTAFSALSSQPVQTSWTKKVVRRSRVLVITFELACASSEGSVHITLSEADREIDVLELSHARLSALSSSALFALLLPRAFRAAPLSLKLRYCLSHFVGVTAQYKLALLARPDSLLPPVELDLPRGAYDLYFVHQCGLLFALLLLPAGGEGLKLELKMSLQDFWSFFSVVAAADEAQAELARLGFNLRVDRGQREELQQLLLGLVSAHAPFLAQQGDRPRLLRVGDLREGESALLSCAWERGVEPRLTLSHGEGKCAELELPAGYLSSLFEDCRGDLLGYLLLRAVKVREGAGSGVEQTASFRPRRVLATRCVYLRRGYWLPLVAELIDLGKCLLVVRLRLEQSAGGPGQVRFLVTEETLTCVCAVRKKRPEFFAETFKLFHALDLARCVEADAPLRFRAGLAEASIWSAEDGLP